MLKWPLESTCNMHIHPPPPQTHTNANTHTQDNWRPGRTIMLCSWDAEEPGLIGSTEFVEDKGKLLRDGTVAYLNVDSAMSGLLHINTCVYM